MIWKRETGASRPDAATPSEEKRKWLLYKGPFCAALMLFTYVFLKNAWVVDDAYITFRTIGNFVDGHGLRWNVGERVQVYTHPLWLFLMSFFYFFTKEVFYTSILVSYALCVGAFLLVYRMFAKNGAAMWKPAFLVAILIASKAFIDYTSSGLENPLSYFLGAAFFSIFFTAGDEAKTFSYRTLFGLFFVASLAAVTRQDTLLLYLPVLLYLFVLHLRRRPVKLLATVGAATLPATGWLAFSLLYYGSPVPNTVYAKLVNAKVPIFDRVFRGGEYLYNSLDWDLASHAVFLVAILLSFRSRNWKSWLPLLGVALYLAYIVIAAASATHMSGRFFALPFFVAFFMLTHLLKSKKEAGLVLAMALAYVVWSPISSIKADTRYYQAPDQPPSAIDTKWYVYREGAALASYDGKHPLPNNRWLKAGELFSKQPQKVHVGGVNGGSAIGFFAYGAGPEKHIIDYLALTDPLLAKLPAKNTGRLSTWSSGHFLRLIPEGYVETALKSTNKIVDPSLHEYYDKVLNITRGRIFSWGRIGDIVKMNTGQYDYLLDEYYLTTNGKRFREVIQKWRGPVG